MGKLIVIEGLDGSGKSTQLELLYKNLKDNGYSLRQVSFPNYEDESSALVKMYLAGQFGNKPGDVNAFAASCFYAVDRYASFKKDWGEFYNEGGLVVSGRYTTSNAIHQCSKLPESEWAEYLSWLYDFEYEKLGIPRPDKVIFLDMPNEVSQKLMDKRYSANGGHKDIHESDLEYLERCRRAALFTAEFSKWDIISCAEKGELRSIEDIAAEILERTVNF